MSLAVRSPRRSALGVAWCEDFKRGKLGVRKNQGIVTGALGVHGRWGVFDGASRIMYPHLVTRATAITVAVDVRNVVDTGGIQTLVSQGTMGGAQPEFELYLNVGGDYVEFYLRMNGGDRWASLVSPPSFDGQWVGTWADGDRMRLHLNGVLAVQSGAPFPGTIDDNNAALAVGTTNSGAHPCRGEIADPLVEFRQWSDAEILAYYNRSLFH